METKRVPARGAHAREGPATHSSGVDPSDTLIPSSGISLRLWRLYAYFWFVCLLFPILALVQAKLAPIQWFIALGGLLSFVASYGWVMWPHPLSSAGHARAQSQRALVLFAILTVLVLMLSLVYGSAFLWLFVGVSAIAGVTLPARSAFVVVMLLTLLTLFTSVVVSGGIAHTDWLHIIPLALLVRGLGLDIVGLTRLASALRELHAARRELARLAVIEERLRMARDLHDLLGHTLSLITLKSELAGRLITTAPARAAEEIQEVERVARQTLREVREAVAGYRQPALHSELDGAQQLLEAAGIAWTIENTTGELPPATDVVLAWTIREGVTNVIRHNHARWCGIRVTAANDTACVEVTNDSAPRQDMEGTHQRIGSGLAGLTERVRAAGGQIAAGPFTRGDTAIFRLWVEIPLHSHGAVAQERES